MWSIKKEIPWKNWLSGKTNWKHPAKRSAKNSPARRRKQWMNSRPSTISCRRNDPASTRIRPKDRPFPGKRKPFGNRNSSIKTGKKKAASLQKKGIRQKKPGITGFLKTAFPGRERKTCLLSRNSGRKFTLPKGKGKSWTSGWNRSMPNLTPLLKEPSPSSRPRNFPMPSIPTA